MVVYDSDNDALLLSLFCALCKILQWSNKAAKRANFLAIGSLMRVEVMAGSNINEFTDE